MPTNTENSKALIAQRIRVARALAGLKQSDVAERLGLTPQAISNYERGVNSVPNTVIQQMAVLYRTSTDYLLGNVDRWTYSDNEETNMPSDGVANVPVQCVEYANRLCRSIQRILSTVTMTSPELLPYADKCLSAAIESFTGLSDLFLYTPAKWFDPERYEESGMEEINKMVAPFYEFLCLTRDKHKQTSDGSDIKND